MGEWENGRMGEWENGRMGEWENGGEGLRKFDAFNENAEIPWYWSAAKF